MSAPALAFGAAVAGLGGAWDLLVAAERGRAVEWLAAIVRGVTRAGRVEVEPTSAERRRLALVVAGGLLAGGWLVAGPLAGGGLALAAPVGAAAIVRARRRRYAGAVRRGASAAALAIASALGAGKSVRGALADAARDLDGPAGHELRRAVRALELGEPTEAVLERVRRTAGGGPWDTLTAAIMLQRDAGGDLGGLLRGLAASLDAAERAEDDARAATAQSRLTARLVAGLPLTAALLAELASPGFVRGLLADPLSALLTLAAAALQLASIVAIRRLARPR